LTEAPDPYTRGILDTRFPYAQKRTVEGNLVSILDARAPQRNLELNIHPSRAVLKGAIHELLLTDDPEAAPGRTVPNVAYCGCVEISVAGILLIHDRVMINGHEIGELVGFDDTHMPNHMNIAIRALGQLATGTELSLRLEDSVRFEMGPAYKRGHAAGRARKRVRTPA
jgi:hypothetical protein